jgi:hypothetical protein
MIAHPKLGRASTLRSQTIAARFQLGTSADLNFARKLWPSMIAPSCSPMVQMTSVTDADRQGAQNAE